MTKESSGSISDEAISKAVIWGLIAVVLAIFMCVSNNSYLVLRASFSAKCFAVLVGAILGFVGAMIGDAILRFAKPDFVMTTGGILRIIWTKFFWRFGPQVIGLIIGVVLGESLVLK